MRKARGIAAGIVALAFFCMAGPGGTTLGTAAAQQAKPAALSALVPYRKADKWGYSTRDKKLVIAAQFDAASPFHEGRAVVTVNGKSGYIDEHGTMVIPAAFDDAWGFSAGRARVQVNGKYGLIDSTGAFVVPAKYDYLNPMSEEMTVAVLDSKYTAIDNSGRAITAFKYDGMGDFHEGLAPVHVDGAAGTSDSGRCGYVDKSGHEVIAVQFYICGDFSGGIANIEPTPYPTAEAIAASTARNIAGQPGRELLYGAYIDTSGTIVIPPSLDYYLAGFREGVAAVEDRYIDRTGKTVLQPDYNYLGRFSEGMAMVGSGGDANAPIGADAGEKYGYMDRTGRLVIPLQFEFPGLWTLGDFQDGLAAVKSNGSYGFVDMTGRLVIAAKYPGVRDFSDGLAEVFSADNPIRVLTAADPAQYIVGYIGPDGTEYFEP